MTITFTPEETEEYFLNALCNAVGTGYMENSYSIELCYSTTEYKKAREQIISEGVNPAYEDILMRILKNGGCLELVDLEEGTPTASISLEDVHTRIGNMPKEHLMNLIQENDDVITADVLLQTVFYKEIIFG